MYDYNDGNNTYVAVANREPVRRDFRESTPENQPKIENLITLEVGYRYKGRKLMVNVNAHHPIHLEFREHF